MSDARDQIPSDVKLAVRKKCHFCCVICGNIGCDYDHIVEWSKVREHKEENLVLLCKKHHDHKTDGLLSADFVKEKLDERIKEPFQLTEKERLYIRPFKLLVGGNVITHFFPNQGPAIYIQNCLKLTFVYVEDSHFVVDCVVKNHSGKTVMEMNNNVITFATDSWDVNKIGKKFTIRNGPRDILVDIVFDAQERSVALKGNFDIGLKNKLRIGKRDIKLKGQTLLSNSTISRCMTGLIVDSAPINLPSGFAVGEAKGCLSLNNPIGFNNCWSVENSAAAACEIGFRWGLSYLSQISPAKKRADA